MKSEYLNKVYHEVVERNKNEEEFLQAVYEVLNSLDDYVLSRPEIEKNGIIERLCEPERMISFRVPWVDDLGVVHINRGYRVQFNSAIGPYKGGLRFHPSVNQSIIKFLGFEQTLKNSLTNLPLGGAKGGSDFDPKGKSNNEIMRFCQSFMNELFRHIGHNTDVPAGDIGVGAREVGFLFGQYKKLVNTFEGAMTGKALSYGGALGRKEATGYGLCFFTNTLLQRMSNTTFDSKKVIISGSGNVALYAFEKAVMMGAKVVAMSDSSGFVYNENGLDFTLMKEVKEVKRERINEYVKLDKAASFDPNSKNIWSVKADIALPCATQNELEKEDAIKLVQNGIMCVAEGANMPCTIDATEYFLKNKILYGPGKAANAGGVMVSGFEMSQNSMRLSFTKEEVIEKLRKGMENICNNVLDVAKSLNEPYNTVKGANICGFEKVCDAMLQEGII